ncbi:MAG: hypothetical protein HeimC3_32740 [Candidatus Heimdallarchaeota archaeon LC_3]|nr:MAG: hypothetical protein HeimC3_32740 [Candidatus Heimdallarchaeota archaeon LC_3]
MLFRNIPRNSPNLNLWNELDYVIKSGNLENADKILDKLHGNLVNPEERSIWFDRGARTLFLKGDYLGSVKAMQLSLKSALEFDKK